MPSEPKQAREQQEDTKKEDKERKQQERYYERQVKEYDRAREKREKNARMREEHKMGYADHLGSDPISDLRLTKHALGVSIRKRLPGTRW